MPEADCSSQVGSIQGETTSRTWTSLAGCKAAAAAVTASKKLRATAEMLLNSEESHVLGLPDINQGSQVNTPATYLILMREGSS
jgi:hypothetical protein